MIRIIFIAFSIVSLGGACERESVPGDAFAATYAEAEMALARAEASRNVWSKTERILASSKTAYSEGRTDEAIELANEAKLQAELAVAQAEIGKVNWKENVLSE